MHVLFANTGVQIVCVPLRGSRYASGQVGYGWQRCRCGGPEGGQPIEHAYIQWQVIQGAAARLFLAVDTTCGDPEIGYFCDAGALVKDFQLRIEGLLDIQGQPLKGVPAVELAIRPVTAVSGDAKAVHMVVDFGNSRTGALLLEVIGEVSQTPQMRPFELVNRYQLDSWNEEGEYVPTPGARWFSSKTHWCITPYLAPQTQKKIEYHTVEGDEGRGFLGIGRRKPRQTKVEMNVTPPLFDDLSMVRMGREADDVTHVMKVDGDVRTGVSSPKRYLWARDASWLEGANWFMADPANRHNTSNYAETLKGPYLKYVHEDDRDFLLREGQLRETDFAAEAPVKPRHAPRSLMTAAMYEMLCQAYTYINSQAYRTATGDPSRSREIRTLTLTFPSGMIQEEQNRLRDQVQKSINIFTLTLGKNQRVKPELNLSIDEASAVHLTYIWSELRLLGQDPRLWFGAMHQDRGEVKPPPAEEPKPQVASPAGRMRRPGPALRAPGGKRQVEEVKFDPAHEIRIACIDIGGGTSDLMIARYTYEAKIDDSVHGAVLHQDGISLAGDQLVKRLLERIIVPSFAEALGLEEDDTLFLFGPETPQNRVYRVPRINWMTRLFVPLAQAYLRNAVDEVYDEPISHNEQTLVDPSVLESLQKVFDRMKEPGYYNSAEELGLYVNREEFEGVVHEVFDDLLFDYCQRIVEHQAGVVLLAGLPSKLKYIQRLVRMYLPLAPSRIVPMHGHYAGNWYPYQDDSGHNPGVIIDPKSPVVVGAAIEFMARHGMLPQFKFDMKGKAKENSYFWGVMTDTTSGIREERILFKPAEEQSREDITEFSTAAQRVIIGRKLSPEEQSQASPVYVIKMDVGERIGRTEVAIKLKRVRACEEHEEHLVPVSAKGTVAGEDAVLVIEEEGSRDEGNVRWSWRTLADERYYLDTGGLDNIELGPRGG